ncbi:hypothetical protein [Streptomyces sp. KN37]|uniref:hypothetical protein n=1 Tax=Streptomyces sp. KN37 TaxID=3090667 RepID=UPI002A751C0A|nr:hypothetical protein [Streptomyces sp. KN37]WPO69922.1 hypothetical protein R9806_04395 [Streptomyces sp. KN37]
MPDKAISSAQRHAARHLGVQLPPDDVGPHAKAQRVLEAAPAKPAAGWSTGGPDEVVKASRAAVQAGRNRT